MAVVAVAGGHEWLLMVGGYNMRKSEREQTSLSAAPAPSLDLIFELLSNQRRRYLLYYLSEHETGSVDEIVEYVLTKEAGKEDRHTVTISIYHDHIPKLVDAGLLEYDKRSKTVRYWRQPSLEEWLEHAKYKELP